MTADRRRVALVLALASLLVLPRAARGDMG